MAQAGGAESRGPNARSGARLSPERLGSRLAAARPLLPSRGGGPGAALIVVHLTAWPPSEAYVGMASGGHE